MAELHGNQYEQLAARWGVDSDDASIQLLQAFDTRFERLEGQIGRLKEQSNQFHKRDEQWIGITVQIMELVKLQNREAQRTAINNAKQSELLQQLSQALQQSEQQMIKLNDSFTQLNETFGVLQSENLMMSQDVSALRMTVQKLKTETHEKIDVLNRKLNTSRWIPIGIAIGLLILGLGQYWVISFWGKTLQSQVDAVDKRVDAVDKQVDTVDKNVNSALTRLRRLKQK